MWGKHRSQGMVEKPTNVLNQEVQNCPVPPDGYFPLYLRSLFAGCPSFNIELDPQLKQPLPKSCDRLTVFLQTMNHHELTNCKASHHGKDTLVDTHYCFPYQVCLWLFFFLLTSARQPFLRAHMVGNGTFE